MIGARCYADLFKTGQYGRLYIVSGHHARGKTFHIYVLPEGEKAIGNGDCNPPLNKDAVEVYGIVGGNPGWTESYGWLHSGKWQDDFNKMVERAQILRDEAKKQRLESASSAALKEKLRVKTLLDSY